MVILELHYYFDDSSHTMDAFVQNKCELALLRLINSVAATCGTKIELEAEAKEVGGLINRYSIKQKTTKKKKSHTGLPLPVKIALLTTIFNAPTTIAVSGISEMIKIAVTDWTKDAETKQLEKEKLKLEVENFKEELELKKIKKTRDSLENEALELEIKAAEEDFRRHLIKLNRKKDAGKYRLKFYTELAKLKKIERVSTKAVSASYDSLSPEIMVGKSEFKELGLNGNKLLNSANSRFMLDDSIIHQIIEYTPKRLNSNNS